MFSLLIDPKVRAQIEDMSHPLRCKWCQHVYDGGTVTVLQRYLDCSVWRCPKCDVLVDDRPPSWGGGVYELDKRTGVEKR